MQVLQNKKVGEKMKVFLCGDTGRLNRGCEAIVRGTVEVLGNKALYLATFAPEQNRPMVKELGISMISYATYPTAIHRAFYGGIRRVIKKSLAGFNVIQKPLFKKMGQDDICLNIGGDTYCYHRPAMSLSLNNYTHKNKIKNILWCCSIEKGKLQGEILKDLNKYEYIFAREQITVNNLLASGISSEKIVKVCDPAFFLKKKRVSLPKGFQIGNTVGINLSDCVCYGPYKKSYDNTMCLIKWILKETNMCVCLVPHVYSISDDYYHDWPILKRLYQEINNERVFIIDKEYDCEQLKYIISKCRYFVGARTHSTIAAYSSKIPTLVIGYSVKSKGIATDLFGTYKNYVLPFEQMVRDDELLDAFKILMMNEEKIKQRYEEVLPGYKKQLVDAVNKYIISKVQSKKSYICDEEQCSGCSACFNICPTRCITMKKNKEGFLHPVVDIEKCIGCEECRSICPVNNKPLDDGSEPLAYAVKNLNEETRVRSSSGGFFSLLAEDIISEGGVVFAPAFASSFTVKHIMIDDINNIPTVLGSKYVQSEIGDCYRHVREILEQGRMVLFSGTNCQVAGLKAFLKDDYTNLITQDVICHGVASPDSWFKYLSFRMRRADAKGIKSIVFREKQSNGRMALKIEFTNGKVYRGDYSEDSFIKSYLSNLNLRSSCLDCSFKQVKRCSDITLGDFWGIERVCPEFNDGKGITLALAHNERGKERLQHMYSRIESSTVPFSVSVEDNKSYFCSTKENVFRTKFLLKITENNFEDIVNKYAGTCFFARLRRVVKKLI